MGSRGIGRVSISMYPCLYRLVQQFKRPSHQLSKIHTGGGNSQQPHGRYRRLVGLRSRQSRTCTAHRIYDNDCRPIRRPLDLEFIMKLLSSRKHNETKCSCESHNRSNLPEDLSFVCMVFTQRRDDYVVGRGVPSHRWLVLKGCKSITTTSS